MKHILLLVLSLAALNAFSGEPKKSEKPVRQPSSTGEFKCDSFLDSRVDNEAFAKILNEKCDPDRFVQIYRNEQTRYFQGYCCVSK